MRLALRETLLAFRRAPLLSALGIITIAFSLFAFGLFGLVALNIRLALGQVEERVEIQAFVADATPPETIAAAMGDIAAFPEVAHVDFIPQDSALARAKREIPEYTDVFEKAVLPASIDVRLKAGHRDPASVTAVADRIGTYAFVDDVEYAQDWVNKIYRWRTIATLVGIVLGLAFAAVAVIIIGATIRMAVLARSREISIMRLVGATDGFIRAPFLIEGFAKGVLGGALALLLTWVAARLISDNLIRVTFFDPGVAALGVLFGALIGLIGSTVSVGRQLHRV
ncbi:MAG TPA: permease-like cell division protein FtsX [Gemmatimonadaceae bacterium]|nr:permease-like cell division protein FtsX [Gemmatimonadaceae bacterium]